MKRISIALLSLVLIVTSGRTTSAQNPPVELRVRIEAADGLPLAGALVAILDDSSRVVTEVMSSMTGTGTLKAPAGVYRVRVRRIGFRPFISGPISIPRNDEVVVTVETPRVVLDTVVVTAKAQCRNVGEDAGQLSMVWDEIDKSLRSSQLSIEDISAIGSARIYRAQLDVHRVVVSSDTAAVHLRNQKPFGAVNAEFLARFGYVHGGEVRGWEYFGPDEAVLLSDSFRRTHCFSLARDKSRSGHIGVAFKPVPGRKVSDISGTFWVNDTSAALVEIVFTYSNAGLLSRYGAGGFARFRRLSSGAVIVDTWELSAPTLEIWERPNQKIRVTGYTAHGGTIMSAAQSDSLAGDPTKRRK